MEDLESYFSAVDEREINKPISAFVPHILLPNADVFHDGITEI